MRSGGIRKPNKRADYKIRGDEHRCCRTIPKVILKKRNAASKTIAEQGVVVFQVSASFKMVHRVRW